MQPISKIELTDFINQKKTRQKISSGKILVVPGLAVSHIQFKQIAKACRAGLSVEEAKEKMWKDLGLKTLDPFWM